MNRREWLSTVGAAWIGSRHRGLDAEQRPRAAAPGRQAPRGPLALDLKDFQPRSMLNVPATRVARARHPVIDFHTHLGFSAARVAGVAQGEQVKFLATADELIAVMDRVNLRTMVNLTGGWGSGLQQ